MNRSLASLPVLFVLGTVSGGCYEDGPGDPPDEPKTSLESLDATLSDIWCEVEKTVEGGVACARKSFCEFLDASNTVNHSYFVVGASGTAAYGLASIAGYDIVFDNWNKQAAGFSYGATGVATAIGGSVGAYAGFAIGKKANVIEAWSGKFVTAGATISLARFLGIGVYGFKSSSDFDFAGAAVAIEAGVSFPPAPISGTVHEGEWKADDALTSSLGQFVSPVANFDYQTIDGKKVVAFRSNADIAKVILATMPGSPIAASAALHTLTVGLVRDKVASDSRLQELCPGFNKLTLPAASTKTATQAYVEHCSLAGGASDPNCNRCDRVHPPIPDMQTPEHYLIEQHVETRTAVDVTSAPEACESPDLVSKNEATGKSYCCDVKQRWGTPEDLERACGGVTNTNICNKEGRCAWRCDGKCHAKPTAVQCDIGIDPMDGRPANR